MVKKMKRKILKAMKENKWIILFLVLILGMFIYTSLQTFLINDDLPYSFFYRSEERVTTLGQVVKNQISDYYTINGRVIVHMVVQTLLIFGKSLWSILNPIVIVFTIYFMYKIATLFIKENNKVKKELIYIPMLMISLFIFILDLKYVNYWVAGSVNYSWVCLAILIVVYYYLKTKFERFWILNVIGFLILSALHELALVFSIVFLGTTIVYEWIKNKKLPWKKLFYFIPIIIGGTFLITAPGNSVRMEGYEWWYSKSIIERLMLSIPEVSIKLWNFRNLYNVIPLIYFIIDTIVMYKEKRKEKHIFIGCNFVLGILAVITQNGWFYFLLTIAMFASEVYLSIAKQKEVQICLLLSFYAMSYSMIITPLFSSGRTNYALYMYFIILICMHLFDTVLTSQKRIKGAEIVISLLTILACTLEIASFTYIGVIHQKRLYEIQKAKQEQLDTIYLDKIISPIDKFHPDANSPEDNSYWAIRYFRQYYGLPEDINVVLKQ